MTQAYVAEGTRRELERLQAVLTAAELESRIGPPQAGCTPSTRTPYEWLTVASHDLERAREAIARHWQGR